MRPPNFPAAGRLRERALGSFCVHLGLALHRFGTPVYRLEEVLQQIAQRFDVRASFLSTPTSMIAAFGRATHQNVTITRAEPGEINLGKLSRLDRLTKDVVQAKIGLVEATRRIDAILTAAPRYGSASTIAAHGVTSGAVARLFGGGCMEMAVATLIGLLMGSMALWASRSLRFARVYDMVAAGSSALLAALAAKLFGTFSINTATLAGLIVLVPGMAVTTAMTELATNNLVAGTARLMGSAVTFLKLGFGAAVGARLGRVWFDPAADPGGGAHYWADWPGLALAAIALAIILQAEARELGWIVLVSCLGAIGLHAGTLCLSVDLAPFLAAVIVTGASNLYARLLDRNPSITQVPATLLLVPGSVGFRSVSALLERNVLSGMQTGFSMAMTATGLVAGTLVAGLILPPRKSV